MRFPRLPALALPLLLAAAPTELPSGRIWTVGPDADFHDVQPAVDAAASGDIVLVSPGSYGPVEIAGKSLALVGLQSRPDDVLTQQLRVRDLASDQVVLVSGLSPDPPFVVFPFEDRIGARILDNTGTVILQDCVFRGAVGAALEVDESAAVYFSDCVTNDTSVVRDSSAAFYGSTLQGSAGSAGCTAEGSFLFFSGCGIYGGDGDGGSCCGDGGNGLELSACEAYGLDTILQGGDEAMWCELVCKWGFPGSDLTGGSYTQLPGIHRALDLPAAVQLNPNGTAPVTFTFHGDLDERAYLLWGSEPSFEWMPTHNGVLAFDGPMADTFGSLSHPGQRGPGPIRLASHLMGPLSTTLSRTFVARIEPRERSEGQIGLYQAMMKANGEPLRYLTEPRFVLVYE